MINFHYLGYLYLYFVSAVVEVGRIKFVFLERNNYSDSHGIADSSDKVSLSGLSGLLKLFLHNRKGIQQ